MEVVLYFLLAYLIGSIPFAYLIGKVWAGVDVRNYGSGNVGMTNVVRSVGLIPGLLVLILDAGKGILGVYLGSLAGDSDLFRLFGGVTAIAGHNWPVYLKFRGGKGIASSLGVIVAMFPYIAAILFLIWLIVVRITRYISVASLTAALLFPIALWLAGFDYRFILGAVVLTGLAFYRHKANIKRLLAGKEYKVGEKARPR